MDSTIENIRKKSCVCTEHVQSFFFLSLSHKQYDITTVYYMVLGIINNKEMILSIWEDVHRLYENTMTFLLLVIFLNIFISI
jgi:hypothetical protein